MKWNVSLISVRVPTPPVLFSPLPLSSPSDNALGLPDEWDVATYLPVHQFKKQPAKTVWQDSIEEIRNS